MKTTVKTISVGVLLIAAAVILVLVTAASAGPTLWLDASQFSSAQTGLATWPDRSPAGNNVSRVLGNGPDVVLGGLNGKAVVRFSADAMDTPGTMAFATAFVVLNNTQGGAFPNWNTAVASSTCCGYIVQGRSGTLSLDTEWDSPDGVFSVNGAASTNFGPLATHKLVTKTLNSPANQQVRIGWDRNIGGRNWDGDFAEIILFPTLLNGDEITGINSILAGKWGLPPISATASQIAAGEAALGITVGPPPVFGPNLVVDGSFEINTSSTPGNAQGSELGAGSTYAGSTWGNTDVTPHWDKSGTRTWYMTDGGATLFPDGDFAFRVDAHGAEGVNWLYQDGIALTAGNEYQLSFQMWGETSSPQIDVELVGPMSILLFDNAPSVGNDGKAELKSILFTPTETGSYRLRFSADSPARPNHHAWIDDVQLRQVLPADIPEPATLALLSLAVCGLGGYTRRRRT